MKHEHWSSDSFRKLLESKFRDKMINYRQTLVSSPKGSGAVQYYKLNLHLLRFLIFRVCCAGFKV